MSPSSKQLIYNKRSQHYYAGYPPLGSYLLCILLCDPGSCPIWLPCPVVFIWVHSGTLEMRIREESEVGRVAPPVPCSAELC